jgi:hypothetical protein
MTYDVFEVLESHKNMLAEAYPPPEIPEPTPDGRDPLDLHRIWDETRREIRLLGGVQKAHAARLKPLIEAREAAMVLKERAASFPTHTGPRRAWTQQELNRQDGFIADDRLYRYTELVPAEPIPRSAPLPMFVLEPWSGRWCFGFTHFLD